MAYAFWSTEPVRDSDDARRTDVSGYRRFAAALLDLGVHVISRGLLYVSAEHTEADLVRTSEAAHAAAAVLARSVTVSSPSR